MQANEPKGPARGKMQVPSHDPMPGIDEQPIDVGATEGAPLPNETKSNRVRPLKREVVERSIPADPDPDDPVSP